MRPERLFAAAGLALACGGLLPAPVLGAARRACDDARFPVDQMTLYRSERPADIQFYDADGRALFPGAYRQARLVTAPRGAVSANVRLTPAAFGPAGCPIDDPAFWCERSLVAENTGAHLRVRPHGYALSIFVPATYDYKATADASDSRKGFRTDCMNRIWYDGDLRELAMNFSTHLSTWNAPTNAVYVRFLVPHSAFDHFSEQRLVRAGFRKGHPLEDVKGRRNADFFARASGAAHPGEIVLDPEPDCRETYAAAELVREVKAITGKALPIVAVPTDGAAFRIWIGRRAAERAGFFKGLFFGASSLAEKLSGSDGYAIRRQKRDVYAFGATPRGTILACVKLLEQVSDIYWWRPKRACGVNFTPQETLDFVAVRDADDKPFFCRRSFTYGGGPCQPEYDDWAVRHGFFRQYNASPVFTAALYHAKSHGFYCDLGASFLPLATRGYESRTNFWPMINGQRKVGTDIGQPCYSNPEVVTATVANVNRMLDEPPEEWDSFCFDYSDSWLCCECPECLKPIRLPDGRVQACKSMLADKDPHFRSTRTYLVANEVAKTVAARFPEKPVTMLAYIYTAPKPEVKLHPSLRVYYATYDTTTMRFPTKEQTAPVLYAPEGWAQRTQKWCDEEPQALGMYEYFFTAAPAMFAEAAATNLQQMADCGATYAVHSQTQWDIPSKSAESFGRDEQMWDVNAMDQVLVASLFWNPYQDVDRLRAEFLRRVYGAGAPDMAEYYRIFRQKWFDRSYRVWMNCHTPPPTVYADFIVKPRIEKALFACLERALAKTEWPAARRHLALKIETLRELRRATGRTDLPFVPELAKEWRDASSPQWNRAYTLTDFRDALPDPADPVQMTCDLVRTPPALSKTKTRVDFACDRRYLYWRATPDDRGGYVELRFMKGRPVRFHSFFGATNGTETGRIPMAAIRETPTNAVSYVVRRLDANGNCSFGRAAENRTRAYPGDGWRSFSTLDPEVASVFAPDDDATAGQKARPPMAFADPELAGHPLRRAFMFADRGGGGQAMRRVRGVPVYDTGYGSGFAHVGEAKPGDVFRVSGDRWRYGGFAPVTMWFYDAKGAKIRDSGMKWEDTKKDGPFSFEVACPDGTARCSLMIYDSYVKELKVEKVKHP